MNILRHTLNLIGGLIIAVAGIALVVSLWTGSGPRTMPVVFILCFVFVPAIAHGVAAVSVWHLLHDGLQAFPALVGLAAATVATFVWLSFVLTLIEIMIQSAAGLPAWQIAISFFVACLLPLASVLNFLLLWRVLSADFGSRPSVQA
jgi:hypothetical protein